MLLSIRMTLYVTMFIAGLLTIVLPCILPLIPIVLGVSIAGRSKWRPLLTILGMLVSFVGFTFLLLVTLRQFVEVADYMRIGTYYVLLLFGLGFLPQKKWLQMPGAALGGLFFLGKGIPSVIIAAILGVVAMHLGGKIAARLQQFGSDVQSAAREELGKDSPVTAFIIGLTMGLVWVPCAGPALGFAFTLVREQPGLQAMAYLLAYGAGTAVSLLLIGYGGQAAVHSVRRLSRYSGHIKHVSGIILVFTALAFQFHWFRDIEIYLVNKTNFGNLGVDIETKLFGEDVSEPSSDSPSSMNGLPTLPKITRASEFVDLGPWHNSEPFTLESLKGKVVLVDFWTYSCINCIRTLPYIQGYWEKFQDAPFVLLGVHTPEFTFEKSERNVAEAIKRHGLTYPVAQDNDFGTWRAFSNRYWPAKYLIDVDGYIRYTHFGEGAYEETDLAIQSLLAEAGYDMESITPQQRPFAGATAQGRYGDQTPETYLGSRSFPALGNGKGLPTDEVVTYEEPDTLQLHKYYLVGEWQLSDEERQVLQSDEGEIHMKFLGGEINLVLGLEEGADSVEVDVIVDGEKQKSFTVTADDLYSLWKGEYGEHTITLKFSGSGVAGYAFTFGQ